jgi:hypothetical protein
MAQVRIVVSPKILPKALALLEITESGNLSDLFALMISRYGAHLMQTWAVTTVSEKSVVVPPQVIYEQKSQEFPKTQEFIDPEILRISKFIEEF